MHSFAWERGYSRCTPHTILRCHLYDHGEDMKKSDGKPTLTLQAQVYELQGKTVTRESPSGKMAASVSCSPDRGDGTILSLRLAMSLQVLIHKRWVMNTIPRTRRGLPPARWRKGTIRFIGWCDSVAWHITATEIWVAIEESIYDSSGHCYTMYFKAIKLCRGKTHLYFWSDREIPGVKHIEDWSDPNQKRGEKHPSESRGSVHPWYKLPQKRVVQGPKKVLVSFQYSGLGDGGY